ncbi:hypothetical protein NDU88_002087 [Pleurodeles waltl]|uniref:Uncharacterized protein n=1 Tax=Pleurodeles waltl TaxID=8319 RepID=A0AAV7V9L4_PLEWA|nr:hypothetical protein NDU88_002087 [Pleurodeles waltl]
MRRAPSDPRMVYSEGRGPESSHDGGATRPIAEQQDPEVGASCWRSLAGLRGRVGEQGDWVTRRGADRGEAKAPMRRDRGVNSD